MTIPHPTDAFRATRIGILGAGQLGRMLALAGYPLGLEFLFLDPAEEPCAGPLGEVIRADYLDTAALDAFCARVDVATYEFENVPVAAAEYVAQRLPLRPGTAALATGQDRISEKQRFESLSIPVPPHAAIDTRADLDSAIAQLGLPAVLKTRRMGYDGKGQAVLRSAADVDVAWARLGVPAEAAGANAEAANLPETANLILEAFVPFDRELSCLTVRGVNGDLAFYPVIENVHRSGILHSARPQPADPLQTLAEDYCRRVVEHFDYVGVMAFEFFVVGERLLANEIAPRVHNSGHWSIEGAECSQFENHLRAIAGLPLGSTALRGHSLMLNCIGAEPEPATVLQIPGAHLHRYGKSPKPLRKIGHVTLTAASAAELTALQAHVEPLTGN